jgi:hypothetical protein
MYTAVCKVLITRAHGPFGSTVTPLRTLEYVPKPLILQHSPIGTTSLLNNSQQLLEPHKAWLLQRLCHPISDHIMGRNVVDL